MTNEILYHFREKGKTPPEQYSPLTLAYLGDCVYELYVRSHLLEKGNAPIHTLHKRATKYVNASAQAEFFCKIEDKLTEKEKEIYRRGRNAKSRPPKNANMTDYKMATGLEALLGYLYLSEDEARICALLSELEGLNSGV